MADRSLAVALENRLMSHGIYVAEVALLGGGASDAGPANDDPGAVDPPVADGTGLALTYETVDEAPAVTSGEVGAVVRTLLAVAEERDWTPGRLEATSLTTDGEPRGSWRVEAPWFDDLGASLSETEFSRRVLETVRES